jgi:hypothetical protein
MPLFFVTLTDPADPIMADATVVDTIVLPG